MFPRWIWQSLPGLVGAMALAGEPQVDPARLPRVAPTAPDRALSTFRVKPGFRIELVAAEPLVVDPIALSFDENGRLYVVEMRDYSERRPEKLGRIRRLEDTDGDGRFDKSTVFAEGLPWPTAVICWNGGVFVGATPDILYCKDTDGDGVADERAVIFTGFASDYAPFPTNKLNVQALLNSLNWSLDNRIHGATSFNGGKVRLVDSPYVRAWLDRAGAAPPAPGREGQPEGGLAAARRATSESTLAGFNTPLDLRGRDFSFDPRRLRLRAESGGGQYGLSFDNHGRKFVCSNSSHLQTLMYEERYAAGHGYYAMPRALVEIAVDGGAAPVYRISPDEPWRVIRTQWRVSGLVPGPVEGGGRPSGYFTGATGVTIYRGNAFPEDMVGDAFVADCGSNLVHRKKIRPAGVGRKAERPPDEQQVEFLASTDNWFRPVQLANAPDGALYLCDMYREVIEHPWSLPDSLKKHLDLNSGNDRGRLYRLVPAGFKQPQWPRLGSASTAELVKTLEHPNGWHRDTAARLLCERGDRRAVPALEKLLGNAKSPLARLHALHVLDGLGALTTAHILHALADSDAFVRQHAVRLSEETPAGPSPAEQSSRNDSLWKTLRTLVSDPSADVRYQLAFTLGHAGNRSYPDQPRALFQLWARDPDDPWMEQAILNSAGSNAGELFRLALEQDGASHRESGRHFLQQLAGIMASESRSNDVALVLQWLDERVEPELAYLLLESLADGLQRAGSSLAQADRLGTARAMLAKAARAAADEHLPESLRVSAVRLLGLGAFAEAAPILFRLLDPNEPQPLQLAALAALDRFAEAPWAEELLRRWATLSPRLRLETINCLLKRPARTIALVEALEQGAVRATDLSAAQSQQLRSPRDDRLRERVERALGKGPTASRQEVVDGFLPALQLAGHAAHGQNLYLERCSSCHRLGNQGFALGPDLATVKSGGKEKLLVNILDPNREVNPAYLSYLVETRDGESLAGIIGSESASSVTLRQANGVETRVLRSNIASLQSQGQSLMPEGLETGLSRQDLADLLEFIVSGP